MVQVFRWSQFTKSILPNINTVQILRYSFLIESIPVIINSTHKLAVVGGNKRLPHIISAASLTMVICVLSVMTRKVKQGWSISPASYERKCMLWTLPVKTFCTLNDDDNQPHVWYVDMMNFKMWPRLPQVEAAIAT
jgi:hypothetical protein